MRFKGAGSLLAGMAAAALLDRLSKAWAAAKLAWKPIRSTYPPVVELVPGALRLRYAENTGAAFSLFAVPLLKLGFPGAVQSFVVSGGFLMVSALTNSLGVSAASGVAAAGKINNVCQMQIRLSR